MGEVYKALDTRLDRTVAIKSLPPETATDTQFRARFDREARAISTLDHPHICALYDVGRQNDTSFLVMQYLEGETLQDRLAKGALPLHQTFTTAIEIASALDAAHRAGIVHRDLKPGNIMMTTTGVKLLDFGLAKTIAPVDPAAPTELSDRELTSPGMIVGTVQYMAPEQLEGKPADPRTDIFAFGAMLFEMLCGRKAFAGETQANVMAAILERNPPLPSSVVPNVPVALDVLVRTCLAKHPDERCQTAAEIVRQLQQAKDSNVSAPKPRRASKIVDSLAVLPFANAGRDPDTEYLSEGITESLINAFSQLPRLRVIPRTSAFRYKDQQTDPVAVGRDLGVRAVLTGKVLQRKDTLIVQAELLDIPRHAQIWGGQYNRKLADIFAVQQEISDEIVTKLRLRLTAEDKRRLTKPPTKTSEVYQLYLKGRYHWARRTADGIQKGIEYFQRAIDADPNYALAYTGVVGGYILLNYYGLPSRDAAPHVRSAAARAVAIDSESAEAHTSLAFATYVYDWDWSSAERSFQRALDLNPRYCEAHDWYALTLAAVGRTEEALAEIERAMELDPLSLPLHHHAAWIFILARDYDRAIDVSRTALEMEPTFGLSYLWMGKAYGQRGMHEEAIAALQKAAQLLPKSVVSGALGYAYAAAGRRAEAEQYLRHLETISVRQYLEPYNRAAIYAGLGDNEHAFEWLRRAYADRSIWLASFVTGDPWFDSLRGDSRFDGLARPFRLG
jgi:serine/threonine protein kinase/tetratricopeptide (TPR) repeat protein